MPTELIIVTPQGEAYRGPVDSVVLPGSEGEFGVLQNHERFLSPLEVGEVEIKSGGTSTWAAIASGFADVSAEQVAVMVESCEIAEDVDLAKAELDLERAREGLASVDADEERERFEHFEAAIALAEARISVSKKR
jgi:F-type H+-transporting ATPase subunit epsilon